MSRPNHLPRTLDDGTTIITVHRHCNGCGRDLGDATNFELDLAVLGAALPDVREECGCQADTLNGDTHA